jgi:hypothetical protein
MSPNTPFIQTHVGQSNWCIHPLQYLLGYLEAIPDAPDLSDPSFQQLLVDVQAGKVSHSYHYSNWRADPWLSLLSTSLSYHTSHYINSPKRNQVKRSMRISRRSWMSLNRPYVYLTRGSTRADISLNRKLSRNQFPSVKLLITMRVSCSSFSRDYKLTDSHH